MERCFTCRDCNTSAGAAFEKRTGDLNHSRRTAVQAAKDGDVLSLIEIVRLATVEADERRTELKSALAIAFAALGHTYAAGPGVDQVRRLIAEPDDEILTCLAFDSGAEPDFDDGTILLVSAPVECLLVMHPTGHADGYDSHVVVLPLPHSGDGFYETIAELGGDVGMQFRRLCSFPNARRLPMIWDRDPTVQHRASTTMIFEFSCEHAGHDDVLVTFRSMITSGKAVVS